MRKYLAVAFLLLSSSQAQNIRQLGMGGVMLPEQDVSYYNPALYGFDRYDVDTSVAFPLGLLQAYQISPKTGSNTTDLLLFDKIFHPLEWNFALGTSHLIPNNGASNAQITTWTDGWNASRHSYTVVPMDLGFSVAPSWYVDITPSMSVHASNIQFSENYRDVEAGGKLKPNQTYTSSFGIAYRASVDAGVAYQPVLVDQTDLKVYGGVRNRLSLGLLRMEASINDRTVTGPDGNRVDALSSSRMEVFGNVDPYRPGFGTHLDLGFVADMKDVTFGVGVRNLFQYEVWQGRRSVTDDNNKTTTTAYTLVEPLFAPEVLLNAAYVLPDGANKLILGADTAFGTQRDFGLHAGAEYQSGGMQYRAGVGFEKGIQLGLGLGADLGENFKVDVALTGHQAAITRQFVVGVAVGAKIKF